MKKSIKRGLFLALAVLFIVTGFSGCDLAGLFGFNEEDELEIIGTWADSWSTLEITADSMDFGSYAADIVEFSNTGWNGDESALGEGDFGYAVIQYTSSPSWKTTSIEDKFMIFRWKNLETADGVVTMDYAEGSDYPTDTYYDSASEAKAGATADAGFFGFFSSIEKQ